jgi:hypothetical protein
MYQFTYKNIIVVPAGSHFPIKEKRHPGQE